MERASPAVAGDLDAIVALAASARAELEPMRGGDLLVHRETRASLSATDLRRITEAPDEAVWTGRFADATVGYAISRTEELRDGAKLGVVEELYVEPAARGVGVGEALIEAMLAWFRSNGCTGVDALALPGHRATKNFFEESGFTARLLVMHRSLDTEGA
jgi:GNAT superfamily N-acetyltransferase